MAKKKTGISEELREAINEAARAGAYEAYRNTACAYVNYFKAMETLLYNYKKLAALVADEEGYPYAFAVPVKRSENALAAVKRNARNGTR